MALNILYVSAKGTAKAAGSPNSPMDLKTAVQTGGRHSVIVLLNDAGPISTEGVALHKNQYILGEGSTAEVYHEDGLTKETFTAPGSGGAKLYGTSEYNAVVGTHPDTSGLSVTGVTASGGVNNAGIIAETRYHFILSGQSNMAGWANASDFDKELQAVQDNVQMWIGNRFESLSPTGNSAPLDYAVTPSSLWAGPELSLGKNLAEALGMDVYFTKVTAGGASINSWTYGSMLNRLLGHSLDASEEIANQGYAPIIGGMAWNQGESDRFSNNYDQSILTLISQMQEGMGIHDLTLIASGVSPQQGGSAIEQEILEAIEVSNSIEYFSMLDFTEYSNGYNHFSAEAYSYMGYQFAIRFLDNLMGNPVNEDQVTGYIPPRMRPVAPEAENDNVNIVVALTENTGNILDNDSDYNPNDTLTVSKVNGQNFVGQWIALDEGGRIKIDENGNYIFDPREDYNHLKIGEVAEIKLSYEVIDNAGLTSQANITLSIYGSQGRNGGDYIEANSRNTMGTTGDDVIIGTSGNDYIQSSGGFDMIFDYEGHNTIYASRNGNRDTSSQSIIFTGDGHDRIRATMGDDIIEAQNGQNNIYSYGGNDQITTGDDNDYIYARSDRWYEAKNAGHKIIKTGDGNDRIYTGAGDDVIIVGDGHNFIDTAGGNDKVIVGNGNNYISAGRIRYEGTGQASYIVAGDGNNRVYTDQSNDEIYLGNGNNNINSYGGNDKITTGNGNDIIEARGSRWYDARYVGHKMIDSGDGNDRIYTEAGDDIIIAGNGNKEIRTYGGNDRITVGHGHNIIDTGYSRNNGEGQITYIVAGHGNNRIYTDASDDIISLGNGNNNINSYGGHDKITTGSGNDIIEARGSRWYDAQYVGHKIIDSGDGNDRIYTGVGDDIINAGEGNNSIYTNGGNDKITVGDGNNYINAARAWLYGENQSSYITAGDGDNRIYTDRSNDIIITGDGDNYIQTYGGDDTVISGNGDDMIYLYDYNLFTDRSSVNNVSSGAGDDRIYGSYGNDTIDAGKGNDEINIRRGGENILIFEQGDGNDKVYGFDSREDKIQFNIEGLTYDDLEISGQSYWWWGSTFIRYGNDEITLDIHINQVHENMFLFA